MNNNESAQIRRRSFLAFCSGAGVGATLFPGALWAQTEGGQADVTIEMIDHAAKLAGLEFSADDCERMLEGMRNNIDSFKTLHTLDIDQNVPPPLYFNPAVPGQVFDEEKRPFVAGPREKLSRPENLEEVAFWPVTAGLHFTPALVATILTFSRG